ncbi:hypothetical protein [Streptomyces sp. NPDC060243]|uniref:hypothetical protein n=1 Tax=Streptomyces sp. NPDC060243 TaxID=3347081 RepID=UPI003646532F
MVGQLPFRIDQFENPGIRDPVADFARVFGELLAGLDPGGGWCQVFWARDPRGMRACVDGTETPPWDVVEALVEDHVARTAPGTEPRQAAAGLRTAYLAALAARDIRPGAAGELARRLPGMVRERERAAARVADLERGLAGADGTAAAHLHGHLAWARDDLRRAEARCAELADRLARLEPGEGYGAEGGPGPVGEWDGGGAAVSGRGGVSVPGRGGASVVDRGGAPVPDRVGAPVPDRGGAPVPEWAGGAAPVPPRTGRRPAGAFPSPREAVSSGRAPEPVRDAAPHSSGPRPAPAREPAQDGSVKPAKSARKRRRSARFAGVDDALVGPGSVLPPSGAPLAAGTTGTREVPTGARFAGSAAHESREASAPDAEGLRRAGELLGRLDRLRAEGREGEAHMLLVDAAHWPPAHVCALGARLAADGLAADWSTVLWEAAALPLPPLTALATALEAAGHQADAARILRQGVVRPLREVAAALADPAVTGVPGALERLAESCVTARSAEDLARIAASAPATLTAPLLAAAARTSEFRHEALTHALRVAGVTGG